MAETATVRPAEFPTEIKIGWKTYRIEVWLPHGAASAQRFGECCHLERVIRIDRSYGDAQAAHTLLHELMHAAFGVWTQKGRDCEEDFVDACSNGLSTIWRDNPEVFAWIAEGHK